MCSLLESIVLCSCCKRGQRHGLDLCVSHMLLTNEVTVRNTENRMENFTTKYMDTNAPVSLWMTDQTFPYPPSPRAFPTCQFLTLYCSTKSKNAYSENSRWIIKDTQNMLHEQSWSTAKYCSLPCVANNLCPEALTLPQYYSLKSMTNCARESLVSLWIHYKAQKKVIAQRLTTVLNVKLAYLTDYTKHDSSMQHSYATSNVVLLKCSNVPKCVRRMCSRKRWSVFCAPWTQGSKSKSRAPRAQENEPPDCINLSSWTFWKSRVLDLELGFPSVDNNCC